MAHKQDCPRWVPASRGQIPPGAVEVGRSGANGETMYVGRARKDGDLLPGKVVPSHHCCYVGCNLEEKGESYYEVLVNPGCCQLNWVPAQNGQIPAGAIEGGRVSNGEPLFIARGHPPAEPYGTHGGKVHPSHGCAYIPYGGTEHKLQQYEVLCQSYIYY